MPVVKSTTNTHYPSFSHKTAHYLHRLGNGLVWPCHWGFDQLMRFSDPVIKGRSKAMDQFPLPIEIPAKILRVGLGLTAFVVGTPVALLGQLIKVPTAYFCKKNFQYYQKTNASLLADSHDRPTPIQIKTWNLAAMHAGLRRINGTRPTKPRIFEAIQYIKKQDDDILCFQEVFTEQATRMIVEGLHDQYPYIVHNVGKNVIGFNSGLMILSKFPMDHIEFETFTSREGLNKFSQKGVLGVIATTSDNKKIVVTNSHLDAGGKTSPLSHAQENKLLQMQQVFNMRDRLEVIAAAHNEAIVSVFASDANFNSKKLIKNQNAPVIKSLLTQYAIDPCEIRPTGVTIHRLSKEQVSNSDLNNGESGGDLIKARITNDNNDTAPYLPAVQQVHIAEHQDTLDISDHFPSTLRMNFR